MVRVRSPYEFNLFLLFLSCRYSLGETGNAQIEGKFEIPANYDRFKLPPKIPEGSPMKGDIGRLPVRVSIQILSILGIDEKSEEILLEANIEMKWVETRVLIEALATNKTIDGFFIVDDHYVDPEVLKQLWKPDVYIHNLLEVSHPRLLRQTTKLFLHPDGEIKHTSRQILKLKCPFDFAYYPADTQTCDVRLSSYTHSKWAMDLLWMDRRFPAAPRNLYLHDTNNDNYAVAIGNQRRYEVHAEHHLQFSILLRRKMSYQILQTYIPSILFVCITWLCFLIPKAMVEGRIAIVMTTLLTLTAMFSSVRESTPAVSYVKAIDVWMCACIAFVFCVLLEFVVLLWVEAVRKAESEQEMRGLGPPICQNKTKCAGMLFNFVARCISFVERNAFVLSAIILMAFSVGCWLWLLYNSGYVDWDVDPELNAVAVPTTEGDATPGRSGWDRKTPMSLTNY